MRLEYYNFDDFRSAEVCHECRQQKPMYFVLEAHKPEERLIICTDCWTRIEWLVEHSRELAGSRSMSAISLTGKI